MIPRLRSFAPFAAGMLLAFSVGCDKDEPEDTGDTSPSETDVDTDTDADSDADADADADTDADTDVEPESYGCLDCHQDAELLEATQEPEDTGESGGESSGEG